MNEEIEQVLGERLERLQAERMREASLREARRRQQVIDEANRKRATRQWRAKRIVELQNQQNAYGIARVYLGEEGSEALRANVTRHVESLAHALARRDGATFETALLQVKARLRDVLEEVEGQ